MNRAIHTNLGRTFLLAVLLFAGIVTAYLGHDYTESTRHTGTSTEQPLGPAGSALDTVQPTAPNLPSSETPPPATTLETTERTVTPTTEPPAPARTPWADTRNSLRATPRSLHAVTPYAHRQRRHPPVTGPAAFTGPPAQPRPSGRTR